MAWNELDKAARDRAAAEIDDLKLNYPVAAHRHQHAPTGPPKFPYLGMMIDVQALSDDQQMEIAWSVMGEAASRSSIA